ncbi:MAG: PrgI family protein [bacterium]|nr:PrgI family protein [bacterium]
MQFQVPQFIEKEAKIVGPLTFKQFLYLGAAGVILFFLYFYLAAKNLLAFALITIFLVIGALAFAFLKIGGQPLLTILLKFLNFSFSSKIYLWKKKTISPKIIKKEEKLKKEEPSGEPILKVAEKSQLKKLSTQIETRMR